MTYVPKTLLDVLALLEMEEVQPQPGDGFRRFVSQDLTLTLDVYHDTGRYRRPCRFGWLDETDQPWHSWGSFAEATQWLCWRPEYRRALLVREAS